MIQLHLWAIEQSEAGSGPVSMRDASFEDVQIWLSKPQGTPSAVETIWRTELVVLYTTKQLADDEGAIQCLIEACGYAPLDAFTTADSVEFNSHLPERQTDKVCDNEATRRSYSISDNMFGICWMWDPSKRLTKGLMYGCGDEGSRQMEHIMHRLTETYQLRANPLTLGLVTLEGEVIEMKLWIASQVQQLLKAQINTGHHAYANTKRRSDFRALDLTNMSCDVCGLAINVATSTLCMQRIVKLADFILEECRTIEDVTRAGLSPNESFLNALCASNVQLRSHVTCWKRQADGLLDNAEAWKHKANILVQTVFTLTTQRDQDISIQIAHDSRMLAQKATRDSTSMKAIAAVTMCFLPGTFVASLFAMPMFDWNAAPNEPVSKRFWIYWAVTLPLTMVVVGTWLLWTNRKEVLGLVLCNSEKEQSDSRSVQR